MIANSRGIRFGGGFRFNFLIFVVP